MANEFCSLGDDGGLELSSACRLVTAAASNRSRKEGRGTENNDEINNSSSNNSININNSTDKVYRSPLLARKRLRSETYYPAFNSNGLFCRSKFRDRSNR